MEKAAQRINTSPDEGEDLNELGLFDLPTFYIGMIQNENFSNIAQILRPYGLIPVEWRVLAHLQHHDGQGIGELATLCLVKHSAMSVLTRSMEDKGFVKRVQDSKDHRITRVHLTAHGEAKCDEIMPPILKHQLSLVTDLSADELADLVRMLKIVYGRVKGAQK